MKKTYLTTVFLGLLIQVSLLAQGLTIEEFIQMNPPVLKEGPGVGTGSGGAAGASKVLMPEVRPKASDKPGISGEPRYEKARLLLPGESTPSEYTLKIQNGIVFLTDDIALFTEKDYELKKLEKGNFVTFTNLRWPGGRIPYTIPYNHSARSLILTAINQINTTTNLCLVPRTTESNYVEFVDAETLCWSFIGMIGNGKQQINVTAGCGYGAILHEILHAAGMWHEQSRNDRDEYVTVIWENITSGTEINFQKEGAAITGLGAYDYGSIMHYGPTAFSKNGLPTLAVKSPPAIPGTAIGQRNTPSSGDIASIAAMYPSKSCASPSVTNISLSAPVTISPNPIQAGQPFTISTNFLNTGTTVFKGCYYVVIWDRNGERVEAILPSILEDSLPVNASYQTPRVFSSGGLYVPTGEYILAVYFRVNCTGEYFFAGNENFPSTFYVQVNGANTLSVSPTSLSYIAAGGTQTISVSSNTSWTVSGKPEWLSLSAVSGTNNGSISATAAPNTSTFARSATLTFSAAGVTSRTVSITQQAASSILTVSPAVLSFGEASGSQTITVTSNTAWTVSESLTWLSLSGSGGTNNGSITVTCEPNPTSVQRSGTITFSGTGALSQIVTVFQAASSTFLTVSPVSMSFNATGASQNLAISSNTSWILSESLDWLSLSATNGTNNGTVVVTASTNTSSSVRSGTITISGSGVSAQTVTVSQSANSLFLTLSTSAINFVSGGGVNTFNILSNTTWNVSSSASWASVNINTGSNNSTITVTCAPNTTTSSRTANISVWGTGVATQLIIITQAPQAPTLSVSPTSLNYGAPGGTQTIAVTSNTAWTVTEALSWLSVSPSAGSNNGNFTVVCSPNTGTTLRSGTITVSATGAASQTITVNQSPPSTTCGVPTNLVLVQKDYSWFYVRWDQVPDVNVYSWRFRASTESTWRTDDNWGSLGLISMAKLPCTEYIFQVRSVCADTFSAWSPELRFTLDGCGDAYCYSYGSAFGDWIARVSFAEISQVSSYDYGYVNRTAVRGTVTAGSSYPLSLIGGFDSDSQGSTYHWKVWIDYNRDNDFDDSGEQVFAQSFSRSASVGGIGGNIVIPPTATPGITRMRVSMSLESSDGPCTANANYREVEDYGIEIQSGASFLTLSPSQMSFTSNGGNQNLGVQSNTTWSVADTVSWISLAPASGSNNGTVVVTCSPNTATVSRSATITATGTGVTPQTVTVTQSGAPFSLSVSPSVLNFTAPGGTEVFSIVSNTNWTLADTLSWISLNIDNGSNNATITVTCSANTSSSTRSGTIVVFGSGVPLQSVTVTQAGINTTLSVSPTSLSFVAGGGTENFTLTSNTTWTVSDTMSWITLSPASGSNNGTIQVVCAANSSASPRSGNILISGSGVASQTVSVAQSGLSEVLEVSPLSLETGPQVGALSLAVTSNTTWTISESVDWISLGSSSGDGNASVVVNFAQNTAAQPRTATITLATTSGGITRTVAVTQRASGAVLPTSWNFKRTENNHTVILPGSLVSSIAGQSLAPGDYVGIFFTLAGADICAGNGPWTGSNTSFPVFGDDASTMEKDGMGNGENFIVKVWRAATQQTIGVTATYAAVGSAGGIVNAAGAYQTDGFSMISQLNATPTQTLEVLAIPLKAGWNTISSYVVPQKPSFDTIVNPMADVIQVVKDGDGKTFLVGLSLNGIGSWDITQGYRVQATTDDTLFISGLPVNPMLTPIPVRTGWQIIPVFSRNPIAPATALATLGTAVDVLKDNEGRVYIPDFSINTIGQMIPTQGYRLKAKTDGELRFPSLIMDQKMGEGRSGYSWRETEFFRLPKGFNTGVNATAVFLASALADILVPGDEIGIFAPDGRLCGSGKFTGDNLAVPVWGAASTSAANKMGLIAGARWEIKYWKKSDNAIFNLAPVFAKGNNLFGEDDLSIVEALRVKPVLEDQAGSLLVFPNPGKGQFTLLADQSFDGPVDFRVFDAAGRMVFVQKAELGWPMGTPQILDISGSPSGTYLIQVVSREKAWIQRVSLLK